MILRFDLKNEAATVKLAAELATILDKGLVLGFNGDLGTGKTTFIRAMFRALGVEGPIKSPTFSLVETYSCHGWLLHHFDLYRICDEAELETIGFRDYFGRETLCCIEWPCKAKQSMLALDLLCTLLMNQPGRLMTIEAKSVFGEKILGKLC